VTRGEGLEEGRFVADLADRDVGVAAETFFVLRLRRLEVGFLQAADRDEQNLQRGLRQ
jgi:hypothetical protein